MPILRKKLHLDDLGCGKWCGHFVGAFFSGFPTGGCVDVLPKCTTRVPANPRVDRRSWAEMGWPSPRWDDRKCSFPNASEKSIGFTVVTIVVVTNHVLLFFFSFYSVISYMHIVLMGHVVGSDSISHHDVCVCYCILFRLRVPYQNRHGHTHHGPQLLTRLSQLSLAALAERLRKEHGFNGMLGVQSDLALFDYF